MSNIALVLGVFGGGASAQTVLLAGALSMAAGEYISVRSQRELLAASTPDEAAKASVPQLDIDANELALVYRARGIPADEAQQRADAVLRRGQVTAAPATSGFDGAEVVGSGLGAAWSSFLFFSVGAAIPVLPFLLGLAGLTAVVVAAALTGLALMATGATVGVLSGGPRAAPARDRNGSGGDLPAGTGVRNRGRISAYPDPCTAALVSTSTPTATSNAMSSGMKTVHGSVASATPIHLDYPSGPGSAEAGDQQQQRRAGQQHRTDLEPNNVRAGAGKGRQHREDKQRPAMTRYVQPATDVPPPTAVTTMTSAAKDHMVTASASHSWTSTRRLSDEISPNPATTARVGIACETPHSPTKPAATYARTSSMTPKVRSPPDPR